MLMMEVDAMGGNDRPADRVSRMRDTPEAGLTLAERIVNVPLRFRRLIPEHRHLASEPTARCRAPHLARVELAVCARKPVHFIIPAFPGKSANPEKTLGALPDLGERLALQFLQSICNEIRAIYPPGARITICSDGRVFSDLVRIKEEDVDGYKRSLFEFMETLSASSLDHFDLDDVFGREDYAVMREELLIGHGVPLRELRERVRMGETDVVNMFNGIHRFIFEDYVASINDVSRNRLRDMTKTVAYRVVQRSNAWSSLVESRFPNALRLSIHPQRSDSRKIGIMLVPSDDVWGTPWHNVVVLHDGKPVLMKRRQAEALGAELAHAQARPSHYVLRSKEEVVQ